MHKKDKKIRLINWVIFIPLILSACHKHPNEEVDIYRPIGVTQKLATTQRPHEFYLCGDDQYPCRNPTTIWQAERKSKEVNLLSIKKKGATHAKHYRKTLCTSH